MKRELATESYTIVFVRDGKFAHEVRTRQVRVLARAEGWAMVRMKGGSTWAVREKNLSPPAALIPTPKEPQDG